MTSRLAARTLLAALCLAASSCVFNIGNGNRGNVTFRWTFGNQVTACNGAVGVDHIRVQIPGQALAHSGVYACTDSSGVDGIKLLDFGPGDYDYTVSAEDVAGNVLYQAVGTFAVDGDITVSVVLTPGAGTPGGLLLTWTFPPMVAGGAAATCAQLPGPIAKVQVTFDQGTPQEFDCALGQTSPGLQLLGLAPGTHTLDVSARDANGFFYVRKISSVVIGAGTWTAQQQALDWFAGSLALKWSFSSGGSQKTCAQAGITTVNVNLRPVGGAWLYGTSGYEQPCLNGGVQGTVFPYLYGGTYEIFFQALGTGSALYKSSATLPTAAVTAGVFPVLDGSSQVILLTNP